MTLADLATPAPLSPAPAELLVPGSELVDVPALRAAIGAEIGAAPDAKAATTMTLRRLPADSMWRRLSRWGRMSSASAKSCCSSSSQFGQRVRSVSQQVCTVVVSCVGLCRSTQNTPPCGTTTEPVVGCTSPASKRSNVVLPWPSSPQTQLTPAGQLNVRF